MDSLYDMFRRVVGPWNSKEETYEKWISRGASVLGGMFGFPIPSNLIDKGIDAAQWLWRNMRGGGTQALPPYSQTWGDVSKNAPGTEYTKPLPPYSQSWGDVSKNAPGTRDQNGNPPAPPYSGYQVDPRTGQTSRENDPFNYGGYAGGRNEYWNDEFWRGLQSGPGYPWSGGGAGTGESSTGTRVQTRARGGRSGRV
jgi:hypothetical protein